MNFGPFSGAAGLYDEFYGGLGGGHGHDRGFGQQLPTGASTSSVLLDGGTRQLDAAVGDVTEDVPKRKGGGGREEKAETALRSHSEAERRRRERINAHLATLRSMVPCANKVSASRAVSLHSQLVSYVRKPDRQGRYPKP